ncbi:SigE family RNA polymerase sigma factor [Yinghuangia seranimata]|uniref:SigE family RNA polymerase sigma factor n=1 Tax=Yinghuangia seranimata TaxID=408067 RepID=UPI003CCF9EFE
MFRTAYVLTGNRETAEDLLQEALERACRNWKRVTAADSPEAYVRTIVVNLANDRRRRLRRRGEELPVVPDRTDPHDAYRQLEQRDELIRALQALPVGMRTVVVLHYLHDMDDQGIAATLGITPGSVRSQLSRALAKLRANAAALTPLPHLEGA